MKKQGVYGHSGKLKCSSEAPQRKPCILFVVVDKRESENFQIKCKWTRKREFFDSEKVKTGRESGKGQSRNDNKTTKEIGAREKKPEILRQVRDF